MSDAPHQRDPNSLFQQMLWGIDHGGFDDSLGQSLITAWQCGVHDKCVDQLVRDKLRPLQKQQALGELAPFKAPRLAQGDLILGRDVHAIIIQILCQWLTAGALFLANTGGGKSNLILFLASQVAPMGYPLWLSESYKTQLRRLRRLLARVGVHLIIVRARDWKWNLLQCHNEKPALHLTVATDLLVRVLALPPRARSILVQICHELYQTFGIWHGRRDAWPTLFDLYERILRRTDLNTAAREAILDRLAALLVSLTPGCAAYRVAWNPSDLARFCIDFEMRGASEPAKQILLESLLFSVFQREIERGVVNGPLKLVIAFDDSQRFFDTNQHATGEIAPMDELAGIIRGTGISLWVILQTAHGLSPRLVPNLATKIIGRLGSHEDYAALGATMGLTAEQIQWAKLHLSPGWFIGQCAEGDWREPFLFRVPLVPLPDDVDDAEATESLKPLNALRTVFADEFARWQPHHYAEIDAAPLSDKPVLNVAERRFLEAVVAQPGRRSSDYARLTGLSGKRAAEIRERLTQAGLLIPHSIATGARGRTAIVLEPTDAGRKAVSEKGTAA